jgi:hypothetical protein
VRFGAIGGGEFKVQSSKFKVQSSRFKVQSSRFKVQGSRFKVQGSRSGPELEEAKIAGSGRPPARSNLDGSLISL